MPERVADDFFRSPCRHERTLKNCWERRSPLTSFPSICAGMLEQKCRGQLLMEKGMSHSTSICLGGPVSANWKTFNLNLTTIRMFTNWVDKLIEHMTVGWLFVGIKPLNQALNYESSGEKDLPKLQLMQQQQHLKVSKISSYLLSHWNILWMKKQTNNY